MNDKHQEHGYEGVRSELMRRLREPAPARVQLLTGPRQVGKTTLLLEVAAELGDRVQYVASDTTEAALPGWWDVQWQEARRRAQQVPGVLMLDEIQYLPDWARMLKSKADQVRREEIPLHIVATGSSALLLGRGTRESLSGRFEHLRLLHWGISDLERLLHVPRADLSTLCITHGTYPGAVAYWDDVPRWRAYVRDAIVEPAVGRDLVHAETIRKPALLRQVFAVAVGHPAEIISLQKLAGQFASGGALATIAHYLQALEHAYVLVAVQKYSGRELRRRASPPKLVVLNQAILGALSDQPAPDPEQDPERWGRWVENACIAFAWNRGQQVHYWREEPLEVDLVSSGSWGQWAIEVKTGRYRARDLAGLTEFCGRFGRFRPLVLCDEGGESVARDAGLSALTWRKYLSEGPPRSR